MLLLVGFQGITPDLDDLASSRALRFLVVGTQTTSPWHRDGDLEGEVSVPVGVDADWVARRLAEGGQAAVFGRMFDRSIPSAFRVAHARRSHPRHAPSIDLLCHFTC